MAHHKEQTAYNKQKNRLNRYKIITILLLAASLLLQGSYLFAISTVLIAYLSHELLWSDHIFYDVKQDYQYNLSADNTEDINLDNNLISWRDSYNNKTLMLELELKSTISGSLFDPNIELIAGSQHQKQHFERGLSGKRFLNITHINDHKSTETVFLKFNHCQLKNSQALLHIISNPDLSDDKILVISPHSDDAEIAAFGLYSKHNSFITTITAGEVKAEYYESVSINSEKASQLKGRLRAWDSIAVPRWAGLAQDKAIQLGYFCLTLEQMKSDPRKEVASLTAGISDTRYFRSLNSIKLQSDNSGTSNWVTLVNDLMELIDTIKPTTIIMAHPLLDPHKDHYFSTMACLEACEKEGCKPDFLLYANHHNHTDIHPFGLSGGLTSLPPEFQPHQTAASLFSYKLDTDTQQNKMAALGMMHDLTTPISLKKRARQKLQNLLLGREQFQYGNDDFFRKAVRQNELFFKVDSNQLKQLFEEKQNSLT